MADNKDIKSDIKTIYKLITRVDVSNPSEAFRVQKFLSQKQVLRSHVGNSFVIRLEELSKGVGKNSCILCESTTENSVFCDKCLSVIRKAVEKQEIVVVEADTSGTGRLDANEHVGEDITFCGKCGKSFPVSSKFCPHCGTPRVEIQEQQYCSKCGKLIGADLSYCLHCGNKVKNVGVSGISSGGKKIASFFKKKRRTIVAVAVITLILCGLGFGAYKIMPILLVTPEELMAEGNYEKAYDKAKNKEVVLNENFLANLSNEIVENLRDPTSFLMRNAWIDDDKKRIVIEASGKNGFGSLTSSYWLFTFEEEKGKYEVYWPFAKKCG